MAKKRPFRFADQAFDQVFAHGGGAPILTRRVLNKSPESILNFIDFTILPPGGHIGTHTHTMDNEEIYIIITGAGEMVTDGEKIGVNAGDVIINRPGGSHGLLNTGATDMRLVVIEIPWKTQ